MPHVAGHPLCRTMEWRHELALRRGAPTSDEHPMLTSDVQLHLEPLQHHLQTLLDTLQRHDTKSGCAGYTSQEFSKLQASKNIAFHNLVDEHMPMAWPQNYHAAS
jgi:hypothetical protein